MKTEIDKQVQAAQDSKLAANRERIRANQQAMGAGDPTGNPPEARQQAPVAAGGKEQYQAERATLQKAVAKLDLGKDHPKLLILDLGSDGTVLKFSLLKKEDPARPSMETRHEEHQKAMDQDLQRGAAVSDFLEEQAADGDSASA